MDSLETTHSFLYAHLLVHMILNCLMISRVGPNLSKVFMARARRSWDARESFVTVLSENNDKREEGSRDEMWLLNAHQRLVQGITDRFCSSLDVMGGLTRYWHYYH
jgi:hypothetical protein